MLTVALLVWIASALPVVQIMTPAPNQTLQVIKTPTPTLVPVTIIQPAKTGTPKATTVVLTKAPTTPVPVHTAGPVATTTLKPASTQGITTAGRTTAATPPIGGLRPAGTPGILAPATTPAGGPPGSTGSYSTGPKAAAGGDGSGASFTGASPQLAAVIAETFNEEKLHSGTLQGVAITKIETAHAPGEPAASAEGTGRYNADVTAVKKGDPSLGCEDDTVVISLRNMQPESPVAGRLVTTGSTLMFTDPSIRQISFGEDTMTITSLRHAKLFGILDLQYTEVSTITPEGPAITDKPFWLALATGEPRRFTPEEERCRQYGTNQPVFDETQAAMTPGIIPTPTHEYQINEIEVPCPADRECQPNAWLNCVNNCLAQHPFSNETENLQIITYCEDVSSTFDYSCCYTRCMHSGGDPAQMSETALAFKESSCTSECQFKFDAWLIKQVEEQRSENVASITRI
jgi:hypothetical protein